MSSSPAYQPIPSSESVSHTVKPSAWLSTRRLLFLVVAFCIVALGSYKAGQWSVIKDSGSPIATSDQETFSNSKANSDQVLAEPSVNSTNMPGKYSVG
jgi:hypothetical protein